MLVSSRPSCLSESLPTFEPNHTTSPAFSCLMIKSFISEILTLRWRTCRPPTTLPKYSTENTLWYGLSSVGELIIETWSSKFMPTNLSKNSLGVIPASRW